MTATNINTLIINILPLPINISVHSGGRSLSADYEPQGCATANYGEENQNKGTVTDQSGGGEAPQPKRNKQIPLLKKLLSGCKARLKGCVLKSAILMPCIIKPYVNHRYNILKTNNGLTLINQYIDEFLDENQKADRKYVEKIIKDVITCQILYGAKVDEYFALDFAHLSNKERRTYVVDTVKDSCLINVLGISKLNFLKDKYGFYLAMKDYFKREVIKVTSLADKSEFLSFTNKHTKFIYKPLKGSRGQNTAIIDITNRDIDSVFNYLLSIDGGVIIEQLIAQSQEMAKYNPTSVNTVRLPAFLNSTGWHPWKPFFRTGRKGMVVDNAGAGGIIVALDENTGQFMGRASDEHGHHYETHPDSGLSLVKGFIPCYKELLAVAEQIHRTIPDHKYVGFDFALTDDGWVLVEGNWGQPVWQIPMRQGLLKEFKEYLEI